MRISESCVSSETIKILTHADSIAFDMSIGFGPELIKGHNSLGRIDYYSVYLGDDIIIKEIIIFNDEKLSELLTKRYKSKILILSEYD